MDHPAPIQGHHSGWLQTSFCRVWWIFVNDITWILPANPKSEIRAPLCKGRQHTCLSHSTWPKVPCYLVQPLPTSCSPHSSLNPGSHSEIQRQLYFFPRYQGNILILYHSTMIPTTTLGFPQAPFRGEGRYWVENEQNFQTVYLCNFWLISKVQETSCCKFYNTGDHAILTYSSKNIQNWCTQCRFTKNTKFSFKTTSPVAVAVR